MQRTPGVEASIAKISVARHNHVRVCIAYHDRVERQAPEVGSFYCVDYAVLEPNHPFWGGFTLVVERGNILDSTFHLGVTSIACGVESWRGNILLDSSSGRRDLSLFLNFRSKRAHQPQRLPRWRITDLSHASIVLGFSGRPSSSRARATPK